jgi:hypothetical protein
MVTVVSVVESTEPEIEENYITEDELYGGHVVRIWW